MKIGLPYAYNCAHCLDAVIYPVCGEHIVETRKDWESAGTGAYVAHFESHHTEDQPTRYTDTPREGGGARCG